jgi:hypothetical protein
MMEYPTLPKADVVGLWSEIYVKDAQAIISKIGKKYVVTKRQSNGIEIVSVAFDSFNTAQKYMYNKKI